MRDEHGHLVQMNGMSGPLLMGRGIPIAMVPVLPVVNGNETTAVSIPPVPASVPPPAPTLGNGARECKYEDKNRIYSPQQNVQNKNGNRKLPTNGAHRMPVRPLYNSKGGQAQVRASSGSQVSGAPLGAHSYRPQGCVGTYRYNIPPAPPPPYASFPAVTNFAKLFGTLEPISIIQEDESVFEDNKFQYLLLVVVPKLKVVRLFESFLAPAANYLNSRSASPNLCSRFIINVMKKAIITRRKTDLPRL
ncbi:uncharacterized protein NPIL_379235 [Nephila pilipes]|uniref:Uncharacterized protein n=1 Tax=Nephila pilipes TaxID=299642 RepID=A0A8X6T7E6_NEPPI|nr:uncharacterized protein NPIL_379235 [Nephila pilipes]